VDTSTNPALGQGEIDSLLSGGQERRASPRYPYRVVQRMAPVRRGIQGRWREVTCSDLSTGGISFLLDAAPDFDELHIELKQGAHMIVVSCRVIDHAPLLGMEPACLVRCEFLGRVEK
jgi:hypothetical protein